MSSAQATDWPQFGFDQASSSDNPAEPGYSTQNGNQFVYKVTLPSASDSTPIYLGNVAVGTATKNLLFIVTKNGTLLALDASNGSKVWSAQPTGGGTLTTGAPAVDPGKQYVYAYGFDGKVHKYQVGTGTEVSTTCAANSYACWPEVATLKPDVEKGASGLSIATDTGGTYLYSVMNGYVGDAGDYQGHITTINLASGTQNVFNTQCSNLLAHLVENGTARVNDCDLAGPGMSYTDGEMSGIWGRPGAIYDAALHRVLIGSGNGLFDASTSGDYEWGDSVLALNADGTSNSGMPLDSFTPTTYATLYSGDTDLGSTSPALLPSTSTKHPHLAVQSGKDGCVRLIDLDNMSGAGGPGHVGGELNAATSCSSGTKVNNQVRTQPAVWVNPADGTTWFYIATDGNFFGIHLLIDGSGNPSLSQVWKTSNGGTSPVVANSTVYYVGSPNTIYALNPTTGATIWSVSSVGGGIHWQSPIVINSRLYVIDNTSTLWVYQLDGVFKNGFGTAANGYR